MKTTNRYTKPSFRKSSEKSFGAKPWERDSARGDGRDFVRKDMHRATCGDCGRSCEVPFKPTNGRKVLCSTCFQGSAEQPRSGASSSRRGAFGDRPSYKSEPRFGGAPSYRSESRGDKGYDEQFKILNAKLDIILKALR